jgi:tetratricopeptide (TPR) repeat protein/predicted Ser/Thr protein kinase
LPTGTVFAKRYQIIEELGKGGMGRVYRVADTTLGEEIALKLIRPEIAADKETLERFKTELKLARLVVHKNVARMFDLNVEDRIPYITMEYVRGEDLKRLLRKVGHLFAGQAIPIACQICEGLTEAHRLGIVHRDLKPQNIMIDEEGQAKIMDFGLARLSTGDDNALKKGTEGTPAYISPEQIKGIAPDARSDLYSLGVLMYEMLTGTLPFKADSARELLLKHQAENPRDPRELNPGISAGLSQVVMKCLEKDPGTRFQSAAEIRGALDCLPTPGPRVDDPGIPPWRRLVPRASIAVLVALVGYGAYRLFFAGPEVMPATSTIAVLRASESSPGPPAPGFALELQDALSAKLAGISGLMVIPKLTVNSVDTKGKSSKEIGRLLKSDYLLEPSFRIEEPDLFLRTVLINARRDHPARSYELVRNVSDVSAVKEEFCRGISTVLRGDLAEDRVQITNKGVSANLEARVLFHEGMRLIEEVYPDKRSNDVFEEALDQYKQALTLDPDYTLALWALGNAYEARYNNTPRERRDPDDLKMMCEFYYRAYAKNKDSPETNIGLGWAHFNRGEFAFSFEFFKNALRLEPRNAFVNLDVGAFLRSIGLYEQAMRFFSRAAKLDPADSEPNMQFAQCLVSMGRFGEAAERYALVLGEDPDNIAVRHLRALQLALDGQLGEADKEVTAIRGLDPKFKYLPMTEAVLAAAKGEKDRALALKGKTEYLSIQGTCFYLLLGMKDEAIANIEAGIEKGFATSGAYLYSYPSLVKNPGLKTLHGDPRFEGILKKQKERYRKELKKFEDI